MVQKFIRFVHPQPVDKDAPGSPGSASILSNSDRNLSLNEAQARRALVRCRVLASQPHGYQQEEEEAQE